ncbi:MAG: hypothetical protein ACC652_08445 [Acidimicrobiales bacterium]
MEISRIQSSAESESIRLAAVPGDQDSQDEAHQRKQKKRPEPGGPHSAASGYEDYSAEDSQDDSGSGSVSILL